MASSGPDVIAVTEAVPVRVEQRGRRSVGEVQVGTSGGVEDGRVTISRRRVESMLVDAYRDKLAGMTDGEVSRLFEMEVLKAFPTGSILGKGEFDANNDANMESTQGREKSTGDMRAKSDLSGGRVAESSSAGTTSGDAVEDETGLLLRTSGKRTKEVTGEKNSDVVGEEGGDNNSNRLGGGRGLAGTGFSDGLLGGIVSKMFGDVQDPKEVAVPLMGTGALVLGVALMYRLISTLSSGNDGGRGPGALGGDNARRDEIEFLGDTGDVNGNVKDTGGGNGLQLPLPAEDPYTRFESIGSGEVIWQRRSEPEGPEGPEGPEQTERKNRQSRQEATLSAEEDAGDNSRQLMGPEVEADPWRTPLPGTGGEADFGTSKGRNTITNLPTSSNPRPSPKLPTGVRFPPTKDVLDNAEGVVSRRQ